MNYFQIDKKKIRGFEKLSLGDPMIVGDFNTKDWYDEELDVSDIPFTLLFAAINNRYSIGFDMYIGIDVSFERFCEKVIADLEEGKTPNFCGSNLINFDELNKSGKIHSTKEWNKKASQNGMLWISDSGAVGSIQGIVTECRNFLMTQK